MKAPSHFHHIKIAQERSPHYQHLMRIWHLSSHSPMIIESCGSKETTKGTFLLIYLQSSLGQRQSPRYLSCLLLSEAQVVVPSVVPSALVSLACYSVCHADFYLILLPTADTLGEFRPWFKFMQLIYYVGRACPRFSGNGNQEKTRPAW